MVVSGILLLAWNPDARATAPWWAPSWALLLGNGLLIFGMMLPFLWLRRAAAIYQEKTGPAKVSKKDQE